MPKLGANKLELSKKLAVIVWSPSERPLVEIDAAPFETFATPEFGVPARMLPFSVNVTVPWFAPGELLTVAVRLTVCPNAA